MRVTSDLAVVSAALVVGLMGRGCSGKASKRGTGRATFWCGLNCGFPRYARAPSMVTVPCVFGGWFFCVSWVSAVVDAVNMGAWEKYDALRIFLSLVPGIAMVGVGLACAFVAARFLKPTTAPPNKSLERTREDKVPSPCNSGRAAQLNR
jgi:hypothetical protein